MVTSFIFVPQANTDLQQYNQNSLIFINELCVSESFVLVKIGMDTNDFTKAVKDVLDYVCDYEQR